MASANVRVISDNNPDIFKARFLKIYASAKVWALAEEKGMQTLIGSMTS